MKRLSKDVYLLLISQVFVTAINALFASVSGLLGKSLTGSLTSSTLPIAAATAGSLLMVYPLSRVMARYGRKKAFLLGAIIGVSACPVFLAGLALGHFYLVLCGAFFVGAVNASCQYYRFAVAEAVTDENDRVLALSLLTGVMVIGGILGPLLGAAFAAAVPSVPFFGSFVVIAFFCIGIFVSHVFLSAGSAAKAQALPGVERDAAESKYVKNVFLKATFLGMTASFVMHFIMNAAPLAMSAQGTSLDASTSVMQIHFAVGVLPSFFFAALYRYVNPKNILYISIALGLIECLVLVSFPQTHTLFAIELGLAGLVHCLIINVSNVLVVSAYGEKVEAKAQGFNSFVITVSIAAASAAAGVAMAYLGWEKLNYICVLLLMFAAFVAYSLRLKMGGKRG
ncbi:MAG: MFS transporter [Peptococcaceae bacterium]|nr:MFS transporter [Peptococcaceae bacterium]